MSICIACNQQLSNEGCIKEKGGAPNDQSAFPLSDTLSNGLCITYCMSSHVFPSKRHTRQQQQGNISSVMNSHSETIEFCDVPFRVCLRGFILHMFFFVGVHVCRTLWGAAPAAAVASGYVAPLRLTFFSNRAHLLSLHYIQFGLGWLHCLFSNTFLLDDITG